MMSFRTLTFRVNPFWLELSYFIILSLLGFLALRFSKPRTSPFIPKDLDVFFTSVSSATVSSMSTVEMEVFSNTQLIFITFLMFLGGECFTSWLGLHLTKCRISVEDTVLKKNNTSNRIHYVELGLVGQQGLVTNSYNPNIGDEKSNVVRIKIVENLQGEGWKLSCIRVLAGLVLSYILVVHILGTTLVATYMGSVPSARKILQQKGIRLTTFAVFTTVSTFTNCGFIPTNENMMVFKKNSGLLLILIPQILLGNTMYPVFLRLTIWFLEKITKRWELKQILKNSEGLGCNYSHLLSGLRCKMLAVTVFGLIFVQLIVFVSLEWHSEAGDDLSVYEKFVGSLFVVVNSRHAGESVFDLSAVAPAILVMFVVMMYLPSYTTFFPIMDEKDNSKTEVKKRNIIEKIMLSPLGSLAMFTVLICITERHKMKEDPLNFNVLNIVVEVVSAYGNVGFSMGYSCGRQIKPDGHCKDKLFGFVGKWSNTGKFILIIVMFFGRLKNFHIKAGKAWKLS